jgi:hypothetical protein
VRELDWGTDKDAILSICPHPIDCIIATDVVYDETVIDALVHVLQVLLNQWSRAVAYVTSTVRSKDTYQYLISRLDAEGMARKIIPVESSSALFHYDRNQHYELLELKVGVAR